MFAGPLDRRIVLERRTGAADDFGHPAETWTTLATVWASKEDVSDAERLRAAERAAIITTRFQIRHSTTVADLNPKDRLSYGGRIYDINAVKEIGRKVGLEITAAARAE